MASSIARRSQESASLRRTASVNSALSKGLTAPDSGVRNSRVSSKKDSVKAAASQRDSDCYESPKFEKVLKKGNGHMRSYMKDYKEKPNRKSMDLLERLETSHQDIPTDHRFHDDRFFKQRLERIRIANETTVIHKLHDLVCPAPEDLAALTYHGSALQNTYNLFEDSMNEGWSPESVLYPSFGKPQPDYCVGFQEFAFPRELRKKIEQVSGDGERFSPTANIYFPFLACEAKSPKGSFRAATRQNAHTLTLAVMMVVELFRGAGMQKTIDREILGFSVAYNHQTASACAHYPVSHGEETDIYIHEIFGISLNANADRWKMFQFVKNIYELWAPEHLKRIESALIALDPNWSTDSTTTRPGSKNLSDEADVVITGTRELQLQEHSSIDGGRLRRSPRVARNVAHKPTHVRRSASPEHQSKKRKTRSGN
ncbi:hypothetical protein MPH_01773 [Macrophomina phaseolina MS6]|uniref:DUF7924 domain-containing protein n=1 Tax=Macrophomina phaseolina (strain MS6) TaxID=1126212 RepID=K2SEP6_MACPH|nr:hypothetical protein MPH_01773 [Macrophomina phaseolina MS6]